ncbi:hypothetical protein [Streptococcus sp.]
MKKLYLVVDSFIDSQDEGVFYPIGAIYPREGYEPDEKRVKSFLKGENAKGSVLIKELIQLPAKDVVEVAEEPEKELNRDEIKAKLDELGVDYKKNARTEVLADLLAEQEGE